MTNDNFYGEILTEHWQRPAHKHLLEKADVQVQGVNASCGDSMQLEIKWENDKVMDVAFMGNGCAVSMASADIMCELIKGKSKQELEDLIQVFEKMKKGEIDDEEKKYLGEAIALENALTMPLRVKCASLAWETLKEALARA